MLDVAEGSNESCLGGLCRVENPFFSAMAKNEQAPFVDGGQNNNEGPKHGRTRGVSTRALENPPGPNKHVMNDVRWEGAKSNVLPYTLSLCNSTLIYLGFRTIAK
jgi:hypothetical protein